jgi:hypothetical protein
MLALALYSFERPKRLVNGVHTPVFHRRRGIARRVRDATYFTAAGIFACSSLTSAAG